MCRDHAHTCLRIAPRRSVGDVAGRLRGKGAMIPRERRPERGRLANVINLSWWHSHRQDA